MGFAATAVFPSAIAGVNNLLNWQNKFTTTTEPTLASALSSTATSTTLTSGTGAGLPPDNFMVTIDNEIIFVGTRSGDTLTGLVRGQEGSTAATHASYANVDAYMTAKAHNQVAAEINAIETALGVNLANVVLASALGQPNGVCILDGSGNVDSSQLGSVVNASELGVANGVATLDGTGKVPVSQLPSGSTGGAQLNVANTWTAKQSFPAATSGGSTGLNIGAAGTRPTSHVADGDIYIDATSHGLCYYTNGNWNVAEWQGNKNQALGYCGLDAAGHVALSAIPSGVVVTTMKDAANGYVGTDASGHADESTAGVYPKTCVTAPVTVSSSTTGDQNLMQWVVPAGYLDLTSRVVRLIAMGTYAIGTSACNMTLKFAFIGLSSIIYSTFPVAANANGSWFLEAYLTRTATGSSGICKAGGTLQVQGAQISPASNSFTIDLTVSTTLATAVNFSVASGSNACTQNLMIVERINW